MVIMVTASREDSRSYKVAKAYKRLLSESGIDANIFSMSDLPSDFIQVEKGRSTSETFLNLLETYIVPEKYMVVIMPEYNGSFPGIFKLFIDVSDVERCYRNKRIALVGVASGRAGNLRGLDHLTDIFHHMGAEVLSYKVPISGVHQLMDEKGELTNTPTLQALQKQIEMFRQF